MHINSQPSFLPLQRALLPVFNIRLCPSDLANIAHCILTEWAAAVHSSGGSGTQGACLLLGPIQVLKAIAQHTSVFTSQVRRGESGGHIRVSPFTTDPPTI